MYTQPPQPTRTAPLTGVRTLILTSLVALTLASCSETGRPPDAQTTPEPEDRIEALVHGPVDSEYLTPFRDSLNLTTYDGSQKPEDFDMLVFDGDTHTPDEISEDKLVRQALRKEKWVLGVDLTEAHKRGGLEDILNASTCGPSLAYAMRATLDYNGRPAIYIVEDEGTSPATITEGQPTTDSPSPTPSCEDVAPQSLAPRKASAAFARVLLERLRSGNVEAQDVGGPPSQIPSDLIYTTFNFTSTASKTANCSPRGCFRTQETEMSQTDTYTVFLQNKASAQGDFQWVLLDTDVSLLAAVNDTFVNIKGKDSSNWTNNYDDVSYFSGAIDLSVYQAAGDLSTQATSPETVNGQSQVTSGVSFSVGFSGQDPGGSFTYSDSVTKNITDWKVTNETSNERPTWKFRSNNPFNFDISWGCNPDQDAWTTGCWLTDPNDLSVSNAQFHTQALFKSQGLIDGARTITMGSDGLMIGLSCVENGGFWCDKQAYSHYELDIDSAHTINLGAVIPVPIASVSFAPGASVKAGTTVTGTVTLSKPAQVDTTISLASNSDNATVLPNVTIKQGDTSATFQVLTNANGIAAGGSTVATIDAFYAENFQAQLTVTN